MDSPQIDMTSLTQAVQDLQTRLDQANSQIANHQTELSIAAQKVTTLESELHSSRNLASASSGHVQPKKNRPVSFSGRGSVSSWCAQMDNYLENATGTDALNIALSYLSGNAHEWWIVYHKSTEGSPITNWLQLRLALINRFETLNKEKIARDKLARWKQAKDVSTFNDDFNKIMLDIPDMGPKDQIDWYSRGLKSYIWRAICTKDYTSLSDLMSDAERVEAAYRRSGVRQATEPRRFSNIRNGNGGPVPMEIGNVQVKPPTPIRTFEIKKLTKEERDRCIRDGLCLRCRQSGHMARNCPKGRKN